MNYKLLKPISHPLYSFKEGTTKTKEEWWKLVPSEWLTLSSWFAPVSHPAKEEIIEEYLPITKDWGGNPQPNYLTFMEHARSAAKSCMDAHASSVCEQLIELLENRKYLLSSSTAHGSLVKESCETLDFAISVIRNFQTE